MFFIVGRIPEKLPYIKISYASLFWLRLNPRIFVPFYLSRCLNGWSNRSSVGVVRSVVDVASNEDASSLKRETPLSKRRARALRIIRLPVRLEIKRDRVARAARSTLPSHYTQWQFYYVIQIHVTFDTSCAFLVELSIMLVDARFVLIFHKVRILYYFVNIF